jgi:hypothetical protein
LTSPIKYNDPFDCAVTLSAKELFANAIKNHLDDIPGLDKLYELFPDDKINDLRLIDNTFRYIISRFLFELHR